MDGESEQSIALDGEEREVIRLRSRLLERGRAVK